MKKVLALFLLGSVLLLVQVYAVSAGTALSDRTISIECSPTFSVPQSPITFGDDTNVTWEVSADCTTTADSVRIVFGVDNPWSATQAETFTTFPDTLVTSPPTTREGDFLYKVIRYKNGSPVDTLTARVICAGRGPGLPSLSTWAVLILVLAVIAVSIAFLRRRKIVVT
ncbi:MAG: hypothetical protein NTX17_08805 [Candidatus Eisenbacteria bacterium]|nr:hypothetical protein [Candidatus Eisenbacteria bacterium]